MKILCVGDIVGRAGRRAILELIPALRQEAEIDLVIANAENAAGGAGLTPRIARGLLKMGCDFLTLGDHVWDKQDLMSFLDEEERIVRPLNFPEGAPGFGFKIIESVCGFKVAVINILGRTFMRYQVECPFRQAKAVIENIKKDVKIIIVDFHAEATSEKVAMGFFLDGEVSVVFGTHTHVPTADETILPGGTAYITDLGMTGPFDSVIGQNKEKIIQRFLTSIPVRFEVASEDVRLSGVLVDIDEWTGKAKTITRIQRRIA